MPDVTPLDLAAVGLFLTAWVVYVRIADAKNRSRHGHARSVTAYRTAWLERMAQRPNRVADAQLLGHVIRNVAFFSSTTILVVAALVGVLGTAERTQGLTSALPFAVQTSRAMWESKLLLLVAIFVYAFFKLTWSLRQFNYCCILIGAAPDMDEHADATARAEARDLGKRAARMANLGGMHFNAAMRAYYFGLAVLPWFIHPAAFIASTVAVIAMMYRRDFHSRTAKALTDG